MRRRVYSNKENNDVVTDGLIARYVGSQNLRSGHSSNTLIWEDLINGYDMQFNGALSANYKWNTNSFESIKAGATTPYGFRSLVTIPKTILDLNSCTVEVVFVVKTNSTTAGGDIVAFNGQETAPYCSLSHEVIGNSNIVVSESATFTRRPVIGSVLGLKLNQSLRIQPYTYNSIRGTISAWSNGERKVNYNRTAQSLYISPNENRMSFILADIGSLIILNEMFWGELFEVRIYNRPLTDTEITHNYNIDKEKYQL